jgi:hypothetical protein
LSSLVYERCVACHRQHRLYHTLDTATRASSHWRHGSAWDPIAALRLVNKCPVLASRHSCCANPRVRPASTKRHTLTTASPHREGPFRMAC